jgi:hypothetical protein
MPGGGALRESVTFQRQGTGAGDGMGNKLTAFADITDAVAIPAELTPLRYGEVVLKEGIQGRRLYRVRMRWTATLAALRVNDRMLDARAGTLYNVKSPPVNPDQQRKYLEVQVERGGASG